MSDTSKRFSNLSPEKQDLLMRKLRQKSAAAPVATLVARPRNAVSSFPLSFAQQRLWFLDQFDPQNPQYNIPLAVRLDGVLDGAALQRCLDELVRRHEVLRTTLRAEEGGAVQVIAPPAPVVIDTVDLQSLPVEAREKEARLRVFRDVQQPFTLSVGPLLRAMLLKLSATEHVLLLTLHHVISDGWSRGVFLRELLALYGAFSQGKPSPLPELAIQYVDYAAWQREWLQGPVLEAQLAYWRKQLQGATQAIELPTDRPIPAVPTTQGAVVSAHFPREVEAALKALGQKEGATPFMVLLAAWQVLLSRYSGQDDVSVGTPIAGRNRAELEGLIGFFVNTLVLRTRIEGNPTFRELLQQVRETTLGAYAHQEVPFEKLVEELKPERNLSRSPLFQVMFSLQNAAPASAAATTGSGLTLRALETEGSTAKFELSLDLAETGQGFAAALEYSTDLFEATTAERMLKHFGVLLEGVAARPDARVLDLPLLGEVERQQVLVEWNATDVALPEEQGIPERFAELARVQPEAPAVVAPGGEALTYGQLEAQANQLAHHLRSLGVGPEVLVGVCLERTPQLLVALLGILKAGGAYVPLDPSYPADRLALMVSESRMSLLLTQRALEGTVEAPGLRRYLLDEEAPARAALPTSAPKRTAGFENLAYVVFTSGSTGTPKGVMVSHRSWANAYLGWERSYGLKQGPRSHLQMASFSFDVFGGDVSRALCSGGKLVLCPREWLLEPVKLHGLMEAEAVDCAEFVPAVLRGLLQHLEETGQRLESMRVLIAGSDAWYVNEYRRIRGVIGPQTRLINSYGISETTIDSTWFESEALEAGDNRLVPIGRPFANVRMYVLDGALKPVPPGVAGELYIGGEGVTRGYVRRPELTAERFVPDPYGAAGTRLYRSGDRARHLSDGNIEFLGRADTQVKLRGFRVELGEIESVLGKHPAVRTAVVLLREEPRRLVAYVVAPEGVEASVLRQHVKESLPEYMVPAAFVVLDALPLTPNGKVDRKALPAPEGAQEAADYVAPRTPTEELLANLWAQVLGVARVGASDNFFDLGGHSLVATQAMSRVRSAFGVELPLRALFEAPTVASLAARVDEALRARQGVKVPPLTPMARTGDLPLSFAQQRLWFLDQLQPGSASYNVATAVRLDGTLDVAALEQALTELVRRHESLRTTIQAREGQPFQVVAPPGPVAWDVLDVSGHPQREAEARRIVDAWTRAPFDLAKGPLLRTRLVRLGEREHLLAMVMHHIVSDGWSMGVLVREAVALYAAQVAGRPAPLRELGVQYADYAAWQRGWLKDEVLGAQVAWWRKQLEGAPRVIELPTDHPRTAAPLSRGARRTTTLPPALRDALWSLGRKEGVTPFMLLLAAWQVQLSRYSGQDDISVGSPVAGRNRTELEGLIGFFVNTLVLRARLGDGLTFRDLLKQVRETTLGAQSNQEVPFEKLVEELKPERDLSRPPLFQVMFTLQEAPSREARLPGDLRLSPVETGTDAAKFELSLSLADSADGLIAAVEYSPDLYDDSTAARMLGHLRVLLEAIVAEPGQRVSDLPLMPEAERQQVLVEWNRTGKDYARNTCVQHLFEAQAARTPDAEAVRFEGQVLTYAQVDARANQLARRLRGLGVGPEVRVGLCLERSTELVVGLLGILKAGGAYVPMDATYPAERLRYMLSDAGVRVLVTVERLASALPLADEQVVRLDTDAALLRAQPETPCDVAVDAGHLAYVLYTSGSTGQPKGVMVPHGGLNNYVAWSLEAYGLERGVGAPVHSPVVFDLTVTSLLVPLVAGRGVWLLPESDGVEGLARALRARPDYSLVKLTPAHWELLRQTLPAEEAAGRVGALVVGGEALPPASLDFWRQHMPGTRLINEYGPTETVVGCAVYDVPRDADVSGGVPIGRPIANTRLYVLDARLRPVPLGVAGGLYVSGDGVTRGYQQRPALTAERFVPDPFSTEPGARMYRTGDVARWRADGQLEYLGRADFQVKVRGYRIELGDIEAALAAHPGVRESVVVVREDVPGDKRLVGYVTGEAVDVAAVRASLQQRLPAYLVPSAFMVLESLPLTSNGKVDRNALPKPEGEAGAPDATAPLTPTEELLAGVFAQVLGVERVGRRDDFFEVGGHSLLAARVVARVLAVFGVELPLRELFDAPTVEKLALRVDARARAADARPAPALVPVPRTEAMPLSFAQQRMWFLEQLEPDSPLYNIPNVLRLEGTLDVAALERAFAALIQRHEGLRTTFHADAEGTPFQRIAAEGKVGWAQVDLRDRPDAEREARAHARAEALRPFNLGQGPLLRVTLLRTSERQHLLVVVLHHIVSDGWSAGVLVRELGALYAAFSAGRPSPLPELPLQYADYAVWQREWLRDEALEEQVGWWRRELEGAPAALELSTDKARSATPTSRGGSVPVELSKPLSDALKTLGRREGATPFMVLLAAWQTLLSRYSGQDDISVGTPVAGRSRAEVEGLIGLFLNTLVLRTRLAPERTFRQLLGQVRETTLGAFAHQQVPFERLVDALRPERDLGRTPLFQAMLVLNTQVDTALSLPDLTLRPEPVDGEHTKFELSLSLAESAEGFRGALAYSTDLFKQATVERMVGHLRVLLEGIAANPDASVSALPMLAEAEREQVLRTWNQTAEAVPLESIHAQFEAQVERVPGGVAVVAGGKQLTYAELDAKANRLARALVKQGVGPDVLVGLYVERTVEAVVGMLGILKAGGGYVPMDTSFPEARVKAIAEDAGLSVVVTQRAQAEDVAGLGLVTVIVEAVEEAGGSTEPVTSNVRGENAAYAIFTSGSTGRPKGVVVEHRQLANYVGSIRGRLRLEEGMSFASVTTLAADLGHTAVFPMLCGGGTLHLVSKEVASDAEALGAYMQAHGVDGLKVVPSHLRALLSGPNAKAVLPRKRLVVGGEASDKELVETVKRLAPECAVFNHYGPTETTVGVLTNPVEGAWEEGAATLALGRPIGNARMYVLDASGHPVPRGVAGELYVGGAVVTRGYVGRPELTAERYVPDGFSTEPGARLYRTGDKVRQREDGKLEFLGRVDFQLKIRGYRVELGEVEAGLGACEGVREAVVVAREDAPGDKRLVAYVVAKPGGTVEATALRSELKGRLPEYMVPSAFVVLEAMPLNANGKVDRKALPRPEATDADAQDFVAPRTPKEQTLERIWAQVLRQERVGIHANFFELGGDSIISLQIVARAARAGLRITTRQLFQHPTIAALATVATSASLVVADQGEVLGAVPLTPIQRRLFEEDVVDPHHLNQSLMIEARRPVDAAVLEQALRHLVAHHDALRLRFTHDAAGWSQENASLEQPLTLRRLDVSTLDDAAKAQAIQDAAARLQASFVLDEGLLLRPMLIERGEGQTSRLLLAVHHLAVDGVSWRVLLEDLETAYQQLASGQPVRLPAKTTSFQTWARRLEAHARTPEARAELAFWRDATRNVVPLPVDRAGGENTVASTRSVSLSLDVEETRLLLQEVPAAYRAQINDVLLAALASSMARWTGQHRMRVNLEGHGREELFADVDLSRTVGWFTAVYPVVLEVPASGSAGDGLRAVRDTLRRLPGNGVGYGLLRYLGDPETVEALRAAPPAQVSFNYLGQFDGVASGTGDTAFRIAREGSGPVRSLRAPRRHVLDVSGLVLDGQLQLSWSYSEHLHTQATIEALARDFVAALRTLIAGRASEDAARRTPTDFPLARIEASALERVLAAVPGLEDLYPLSPMQQGMLFHTLLEPASGAYFEQRSWSFHSALDLGALKQAWEDVIAHHPVLRTSFFWQGLESPLQAVHARVTLPWSELDWRGLSSGEQQARLETFLAEDRARGFELAHAPLMRLALIRTEEQAWRLVWSFHHLLTDGWSSALLRKAVFTRYAALAQGKAPALEKGPAYREYIAWLQRQDLQRTEAFWRDALAGFSSATPLPAGGASRAFATGGLSEQSVLLPADTTDALQAFARRHQLTLNTLVQAAWALVLARHADTSDVVFGATVAGRPSDLPGVDSMLGMFINTLPVRVRLDGHAAVVPWLQQLQSQQVELRHHEHSPLVQVQGWSEVPRGTPLFETLLVFENYPVDSTVETGAKRLDVRDFHAFERTNYPLTAVAAPGRELLLKLAHETPRFDDATARALLGQWRRALEGLVARKRVADVSLLSVEETHALKDTWNATRAEYPRTLAVQQLFEARAARAPDAEALRWNTGTLTAGALDARANRLAHHLRALGVGLESRVGICLERGPDLVVALLAVLKAGGAYVPLDPTYPESRLGFMARDANLTALLTHRHLEARLPGVHARVIRMDALEDVLAALPATRPAVETRPEALAYVIYTSGSTGRPKGVMVTHGGVVNYLTWALDAYRVADGQGAPVHSSFSFDLTVTSLLAPLAAGRPAVLVDEAVGAVEGLGEALRKQADHSLVKLTPAHLRLLEAQLAEQGASGRARAFVIGGEALGYEALEHWRRYAPGTRLINEYGPTETVVGCCIHEVREDEPRTGPVPIGHPIANTRLYVLDAAGRLSPVGAVGELYVGGDGVGRGYLGRPDLTAERFVPDPFSPEPGARLYRTGDTVRRRADGVLEYLGRRDDQVKVRGFRIELGEIEAVLTALPDVAAGVVLAREDVPGDRRLVGYVVPRVGASLDAASLKTALRKTLPDYLVPVAFVVLDTLPVAVTGKVDRKALPAPEATGSESHFVAPRTPEEELLAGLFAQVLGVERVGVHDDFFALGGHSLRATQAVSRARDVFGVELPLRDLFEAPTVATLLPRLLEAKARNTEGPRVPPLVPVPRTEALPLSFAQQRLWFLDQLEPQGAFHNVPAALRLQGLLDVSALERAFAELFRRHEALRTVFRAQEGRPLHVILPVPESPVSRQDLRGLPELAREEEALRQAQEEARRPFDLARGPLLRVTLLQLAERQHLLLLTMHHIVSDGWSMSVLVRELVALYEAFRTGKPSPLPELPLQYADYAAWQRQWLEQGALAQQLAWWKRQLDGAPQTVDLPTDRPRPTVQSHKGEQLQVLVPPEVMTRLQALCRREGVTLFMALLAGFQVVLSRYTRRTDIVVGTDIANRNRAETEGLIGFFVNQLVLRGDLGGDPTVRELLSRARETALSAYAHQDLPFEELVKELNPKRSLGQAPLFQVKLVLQNAPVSRLELPGLELSPVGQEATRAKLDLTVAVQETPQGLACVWEYATDLFDGDTVARMAKHFEQALEGLTREASRRLSSLSLLTDAERHTLLDAWNDTRTQALPGPTATALFEAQAARTPDALAAVYGDTSLTYAQLDAKANQLAWHLKQSGVGLESRVGLCVERSLDMAVGILGILKAGAAYLPLDPSYPSDRLAYMLADAAVPVIVTQDALADELPVQGELLVCLDSDAARIAKHPVTKPPVKLEPEHLAYVIYTSGSTGRPKGTLLHHRGLCNTATAAIAALGITPSSRVLQFAAFGFDASVWETFSALLGGAALHLAPREALLLGAPLHGLIASSGITTVTLTPSVLAQLEPEGLPLLTSVAAAGEACSAELVRRWSPGRRFLNAYGPTEVTVCATVRANVDPARPTIGTPLPNVRVYVLDDQGQPVPVGVPGQLHVGGVGLARGYLHRADLTAERFVPDAFGPDAGGRLYATGDLVRYLPSGELEFLGRIDHQLKLRGYRIELGEVEAAIADHSAVESTVVLLREDVPGNPRLVAYVVPREGQVLDLRALKDALLARLPEYMVPSAFVSLQALPLTPNGKLDRQALPVPDTQRPELEKGYVAPRDELEQQLADIWSELLGVKQVGVHDDFFELGGHSLLGTQLISRIRTTFDVELPLRDIFESPTVENLAVHIVQAQAAQADPAELERLMGELEHLSAEEAEALLSSDEVPSDDVLPQDTKKVSSNEQ
ncbi:non-ribosomal peptide synthetase [Corallococcus caeni]|uniref:Non-ribosomal peptide synthase/polyketide synthase n=1 Tax=Corallococcus caeni TaxID=3082388 RepID=A0ABQ6R5B9_9BACT|nr:non-ribosomal peptide synthase/polyketide synthase [Corallococcus sp. NO1]